MPANRRIQSGWIWLTAAIILIFTPIFYFRIFHYPSGDFEYHLRVVDLYLHDFQSVENFHLAHPLFQLVVIFFHSLGFPIKTSTVILMVISELAVGWIVFGSVTSLYKTNPGSQRIALGAALILLLAAPVMLLAFKDGLFYFGYIGISNYHNPTVIILRPLALGHFLLVLKDSWHPGALIEKRGSTLRTTLCAALLIVLTLMAKPNYVINLLPALGITILFQFLMTGFGNKRLDLNNLVKSINWRFIFLGVIAPSIVILGWQYWMTYSGGEDKVIFDFMGVMHSFSNHLAIKFLLSIPFPLLLTLFNFRQAIRDRGMVMGWAVFGMGALYTYLLAESGGRYFDGNFGWSGEIGLFLLFYVSLLFWVRRIHGGGVKVMDIIPSLAMLCHIAGGVVYYLYCLQTNAFG